MNQWGTINGNPVACTEIIYGLDRLNTPIKKMAKTEWKCPLDDKPLYDNGIELVCEDGHDYETSLYIPAE